MATASVGFLLRKVRGLVGGASAGGSQDRDLLRRFAAERDEAAFAALVRRHGGLVFGLCRRLLNNVHDAEDAFSGQNYFPEGIARRQFYRPTGRGFESELSARLERFAKLRAARQETP